MILEFCNLNFNLYDERVQMVDTKKEIEQLRQKLLDLSLRNNLINYRFSKAQTVRII
jgi:hypothetical protein